MRTLLIILSMWLLINVAFVVMMMPPLKPGEKRAPLKQIILIVGTGAFLALSPPITEAVASLRRALRRKRPPK
jgi:hypothetical protein